ncbi:MAG: phage tail length tape measure family protein, partial [Rhodospirillales bacterium]
MGSDQTIAIRLALKDGPAVSAQLQSLAMDGDKAFSRLAASVQKPNAALKGLSAAVSESKSAAIGLTTGLGSIGNVLAAMGPGGFVAAAGIGAVSLALNKGLTEFAQAEQASLRFQAVLRATGNSSGVTARDVEDMADAMESSTMATAEGVKESAAALATFRSVSGDNFKETIKLSQDLAATFGGDLRSAAVQLGKALEDPEHGLTQLRRSGISFTDAQKDMIVEMFKAGDAAKAQALILEEIRKQVGGAGEGEAGGLTGATHHLSAAWGNLFENFVRTRNIGNEVSDFIFGLTLGVSRLDKRLSGNSDPLAQKARDLVLAQIELDKIADSQGKGGSTDLYERQKQKVAALRAELASLKAEEDKRQADAKQGPIDAALWKAREDISTRQKDLDKELVTSFQDAADKKRAIAEQLEKDVATANAKRDKIGYTDADVDAEISSLQRIAANKVEAIEKPIRESQQRIRDQVAKTISELDAQ